MIVGNLGAQKEKRNDTPISVKKDIMGDKTVRVRADLHHIIKFCIIGIEVKLDAIIVIKRIGGCLGRRVINS
ncbi:peptide-binding protein [Streptococcus suis]|uniref:peptide-binding protein n=1 Tax=Streptococcus suis TaxID=1307 RepID=UPI003F68A7F8